MDGQGSEDTSAAQRRDVGGILSLFGLVTGAQIDRYNFETLVTVDTQVEGLAGLIKKVRCGQGSTVDGAPCGDVQAALIHISLQSLPDTPDRARLLAIPTGLTIERGDVDRLIQAGHDAITSSTMLRTFLADYPVRSGSGSAVTSIAAERPGVRRISAVP